MACRLRRCWLLWCIKKTGRGEDTSRGSGYGGFVVWFGTYGECLVEENVGYVG